jgi:hypothetical protein
MKSNVDGPVILLPACHAQISKRPRVGRRTKCEVPTFLANLGVLIPPACERERWWYKLTQVASRCMLGVVTDDDRGWQDKGAHFRCRCRNSDDCDLARDRAKFYNIVVWLSFAGSANIHISKTRCGSKRVDLRWDRNKNIVKEVDEVDRLTESACPASVSLALGRSRSRRDLPTRTSVFNRPVLALLPCLISYLPPRSFNPQNVYRVMSRNAGGTFFAVVN